jgi:hypothetical protein
MFDHRNWVPQRWSTVPSVSIPSCPIPKGSITDQSENQLKLPKWHIPFYTVLVHRYHSVHCIVGSLDHQSKRSQLSYKTSIRLSTRQELPLATQLFYLQARYKLSIPGLPGNLACFSTRCSNKVLIHWCPCHVCDELLGTFNSLCHTLQALVAPGLPSLDYCRSCSEVRLV